MDDDEVNRSPFWIALLLLSVLGVSSCGIATHAQSRGWSLLGLLGLAGAAGLVFVPAMIRGATGMMLLGVVMAYGIIGTSIYSAQSLWYTVVSERQTCQVVDLDENRGRYSTSFEHELDCGGQELEFTVKDEFRAGPGEWIEVLTDPAEVLDPAPLEEVTEVKAFRMVVALLAGIGFVLFVVLKPLSEDE